MYRINFNELIEILSNMDNVLVTFHSYGDRDAIASAFAISQLFNNYSIETPDYVTRNTRLMLQMAGINYEIKPIKEIKEKNIIILDTNDINSLGRASDLVINAIKENKKVIFIDHHLFKDSKIDAYIFDDENFNSTSSIVYEVLKRMKRKINRDIAILLLNGIISDSAEFQNATAQTFEEVYELLENSHLQYSYIQRYLKENINIIDDLLSAKKEIINNKLIMFGETKVNASIVADLAIKIYADFSFFWHESKDEISFSTRLMPPLDKEYNIHLGRVMQQVGRIINGNGGGHPAAAGAYSKDKSKKDLAIDFIIRFIKETFQK